MLAARRLSVRAECHPQNVSRLFDRQARRPFRYSSTDPTFIALVVDFLTALKCVDGRSVMCAKPMRPVRRLGTHKLTFTISSILRDAFWV